MFSHIVHWKSWVFSAFLGMMICQTGLAQSSDYPTKPIKVVVTFPPGGSSDAIIRILSTRLNDKLGHPLVLDNRPGAGGNIGLTAVAKAAPDGYVLGVGAAGGLTANVSLYPQMPFDVTKDFAPITMLASIPFVLVGHPSVPADNLQQLIALAKSQPGKVSIGHGGNGTAMHLSTALFTQMADVKLIEVPYRGSGPAAMDTLSGQIQLSITDLAAALPHIKAGKLRPLGVTGSQRVKSMPDLPTIGASGAVSGVIAAYLMLHPRVGVWVLAFKFIPLRISAGLVLGLLLLRPVDMARGQRAAQA